MKPFILNNKERLIKSDNRSSNKPDFELVELFINSIKKDSWQPFKQMKLAILSVNVLNNISEKSKLSILVPIRRGTIGIALNLESNNVGVVLMGDNLIILQGSSVKATGRITATPVSEAYLGRVRNALVKPTSGRGEISTSESWLIFSPTPGIISRRSVYEPLQIGLIAIDLMISIGREFIIGDRHMGKIAVATDTILNQQGQNAIGSKAYNAGSYYLPGKSSNGIHYCGSRNGGFPRYITVPCPLYRGGAG
ncbi:LOW QUALITY PROTEIN: hypothetical protein Cgig2_025504 [Carnegiea gigantea]|uniref:ATPase F1/V1/A1 complex alpha/beta subunit N-terminal domain-containing protein n=1 Tax=Carnegiea gigantea TaxID=171969 RepID=A0A9Q1JGW0_9CARY|nr:LOW QUALITY PROTEIN: hypothetical protein Cgig2_025504 [Carnegiea gigantea]